MDIHKKGVIAMAKNDCRVYMSKLKKVVKDKIPVVGTKYDTYVEEIIENIDDFRQCYKKGDKVREQLPKYWFVSKEGFLIKVKKDETPRWVAPNLLTDRPEFKVSRYNKAITTYALVSLVWGSYRTPNAQTILDKNGIRCLGRLKKEGNLHVPRVQPHHIKEYIPGKSLENYVLNNDPTNLQLVTVKEHDILNKLQQGNTDFGIFYQPNFVNIDDNCVTVYDITEKKIIENIDDLEIKAVEKVDFLHLEKDSILIKDHIVLMKDGREYLESQKPLLTKLLKGNNLPKNNNYLYFLGQKYYYFELDDKTIFYRKLS